MTRRSPEALLVAARAGDRAALGRLLTLVERGVTPPLPPAGDAYIVGITGAPGAGKSTLTAGLVAQARVTGIPVAVLAIDPTSPFSGGALLGDRVRMQHHGTDPGVYIRSMATRGHLGGLALAAPAALRVLGAAGYPVVLVETVGVGQAEVEVAAMADTVVVVVNPGWGDEVQAAKAGLLEIADVFALNKADRPGASETAADLERTTALATRGDDAWRPPVTATVATTGEGLAELWATVQAHRRHAEASGELGRRRRRRRADELHQAVVGALAEQARARVGDDRWREVEERVLDGRLDPRAAAALLVAR